MGPDPRLRAQLAQMVAERPSATHAQVERRSWMLVALGVLWLLFGTWAIGIHWGSRSDAWISLSLAGFAACGILGTILVFSRGAWGLGRSRPLLAALSVAIPLGLLLLVVVWGWDGPRSLDWALVPWSAHRQCLLSSLFLGLGPFAGFMWARRNSDPVRPGTTGALRGAAAGSLAGVAMDLHCAQTQVLHLVLGHVLPVGLMALLGAAVGRWLLGMHARVRTK